MDAITARNIVLKLNEWRKAGINCDVTFIIGEHEFHAHKNILAAATEFFEKLFTGDFAEKGKDAITLKDVDPNGFRLILDYIYTGEIKIDEDNFEQVLFVANYFQIECVIEMLCEYVKSSINVNNGFYYYHSADYTEIKRIKEFTKEFIRKNFLSCSDSAAFFDITYQILLEFIDSPMEDELERFKIIMKWIQNDSKKRSDYLPDLIKHVCFEYISNDTIVNDILDYQLVINNVEIIKTIKQKRTVQSKLCIYGMNGSDLVRVDILNSKLEAAHIVAKPKLDYDEFQIIFADGAMYMSTYNCCERNRLYRFEDSQWVLLNSNYYGSKVLHRSIVYSEKHKTIYENNYYCIYSYNLDSKSCVIEYDSNSEDHVLFGPLVCYNDFLYTVSHTKGDLYILQYDPLNKKTVLRGQLLKYTPGLRSAIFGDKMFIISCGLVQMYDFTNDQCTIVVENKKSGIFYHSLIIYQNRLYAIRIQWDVIDVFDLSKMDWTDEIHLKIRNKNIFNMKYCNVYIILISGLTLFRNKSFISK